VCSRDEERERVKVFKYVGSRYNGGGMGSWWWINKDDGEITTEMIDEFWERMKIDKKNWERKKINEKGWERKWKIKMNKRGREMSD